MPRPIPPSFSGERRVALHLPGLACRACARRAEDVLRRVPGVRAALVHSLRERADVRFDGGRTSAREIAAAIERAGYRVAAQREHDERSPAGAFAAGVALVALVNLLLLDRIAGPEVRVAGVARLALAAIAIGVAGVPIARRAGRLLRRGLLDHDALVTAAMAACTAAGLVELWVSSGRAVPSYLGWLVAGGAARGAGFEGAAAIAVASICARLAGDALQDLAQRRVHPRADLVRRVEAGGEHPAAELAPGDRVRLVEGQRAPADLALEGPARLVEDRAPGPLAARSANAGELMPRGALLLSAEALGRVTSARRDLAAALDAEARAALARIARTRVELAPGTWDDAALRGLFTAALGCAAFALVTLGFLSGAPLALLAAAAVLAGVSPSALMVAAPAARALAVARARAAGVSVKDPAALEALARVDTVCFEKNGAIASGAPRVRALVWAPGVAPDRAILEDLAALEALAAHPVGAAIAAYLAEAGIAPTPLGAGARVCESANGISGRVRDALVEIGSPARWGEDHRDASPAVIVATFGRNGVPLGRFELVDPPRPHAELAVTALRARGLAALVLSGDRPEATTVAARRLKVPGAGGLGPSEKALAIRDLQFAGARVLLVGDGRNDPAGVAQADVAVAIARGALPGSVDAPIVIVEGRLVDLVGLVDLARRLRSVLRANAALAAVYNAALVPAAALGWVRPAHAAMLMLAETLLGLANAARLLRRDPPVQLYRRTPE